MLFFRTQGGDAKTVALEAAERKIVEQHEPEFHFMGDRRRGASRCIESVIAKWRELSKRFVIASATARGLADATGAIRSCARSRCAPRQDDPAPRVCVRPGTRVC